MLKKICPIAWRKFITIRNLIALGIIVFPPLCNAQAQTIPAPNCSFAFNLAVSGGTSTVYANNPGSTSSGVQCAYWTVTYVNNGFSAVTVAFQGAPDSAGAPGSWGNYQSTAASGALATGSNPGTSTTTGYAILTGYAPWVRVLLTATGSGTVKGFVTGWYNDPSGSGGGGGGGCTAPCVVIGPDATGASPTEPAVFTASQDGAGKVLPLQNCSLHATFDTSSSGNTSLIALSGSTVIRVCHISATAASAVDFKLTTGTGATCGTGTADLTGLYQQILAVAFDWGAQAAILAPAGNRVCLNLSAGVRTTGTVTYSQF